MRQGHDPGWDDCHVSVPLTGREPLLGRLRLKLRSRPGAGWIGLSGPRGAGVSRILEEVAAMAAEAPGGPAPLWVAPCEVGAPRAEPLRRALVPWWSRAPDAALEAALAPVVPTGHHGARAFLAWVGAGPLASAALLPALSVLSAALRALTQGGVIVADDWTALDATTRSLLLEVGKAGGSTVIAGHVDPDDAPEEVGQLWPLEPLTESQLSLLLKRWLRSPVTARRLAPELARRSEGWPGRAIALVRSLARAGVLVSEERGARLAAWPVPWPEPCGIFESCLQRLKEEDAGGWRVIESAAMLTEPCEAELLAEAAGVKRAVVEGVLAEVTAARSGHAPGCAFGDPALRAFVRNRLTPARRAQVAERLVHTYARRPLAELRGAGEALGRLEAACEGGSGPELDQLLPRVLELVPARATLVPAVAELLARAARRLLTLESSPAPATLLGVGERLAVCGHLAAAQDLLEALHIQPGTSAELAWLTLRVRYGDPAHVRPDVVRLEALLAGAPLAHEPRHRACRALAERDGATDGEARRAWRQALATLPSCDLAERAGLHVALARAAERAGRRRAVAGHARRAAVLHEALGRTGEAATLWLHVGLVERAAGRLELATAAFEAAVRDWQELGEVGAEGEALEAQAQTCVLRARYDDAAGLLARALACTERAARHQRRAGVHLALARAHRGRGDLAREREHAARAMEHATTAAARLLARAAQLVAGLRAGEPGALEALDPVVRDLEAAGLREEAAEVRAAMVDARLVIGDVAEAERLVGTLVDPAALLAKARVARLKGQLGACTHILEALGHDPTAPVDLRAEACARLAELQVEGHAESEAAQTAQAASALLELPHRSRRQDARLHRLLARVYREVGEPARSAEHRAASRRALQLPLPVRGTASERLRWIRARWSRDPRRALPRRAQSL